MAKPIGGSVHGIFILRDLSRAQEFMEKIVVGSFNIARGSSPIPASGSSP